MEKNDTACTIRNEGTVISHTGPVSGKLFVHALALREIADSLPAEERETANSHLREMFKEIERVDTLERAGLANGTRGVRRFVKGGKRG